MRIPAVLTDGASPLVSHVLQADNQQNSFLPELESVTSFGRTL